MSDEQLPNPAAAGLSIRSFWKWAIALFLAKNERFGKSLFFAYFRSFWKSKRAVALFVALFERAKEWSLFLSLFLKERKSDLSFGRSFKKSKRRWLLIRSFAKSAEKSNCSFTFFKRANEQAIAQSLVWKERKWAMSKWANERLPNPANHEKPHLLSRREKNNNNKTKVGRASWG